MQASTKSIKINHQIPCTQVKVRFVLHQFRPPAFGILHPLTKTGAICPSDWLPLERPALRQPEVRMWDWIAQISQKQWNTLTPTNLSVLYNSSRRVKNRWFDANWVHWSRMFLKTFRWTTSNHFWLVSNPNHPKNITVVLGDESFSLTRNCWYVPSQVGQVSQHIYPSCNGW